MATVVRSIGATGRSRARSGLGVLALSSLLVIGALTGVAYADQDTTNVAAKSTTKSDSDGDGDLDQATSASAAAAARTSGKPVEDLSKRTESTRTFANADGTWTDEQFGGVMRVRGDDGKWDDVDYDLAQRGDGSWAPKVSPVDVSIADGSSKEAARVTLDDGKSLAVTWPQTLPEPTVTGSVATYKLSRTTELIVTVTGRGINAHIRLNSAPAADDPVFELGLRGKNLDVEKSGSGLKVIDDEGKPLGGTSNLVAWDSKTDDSGFPLEVVPLTTSLKEQKTTGDQTSHALKLQAPAGYLSDPDTQYPVTIDPDIGTLERLRDTYVRSGDGNHQYDNNLAVGKISGETNQKEARAYLKFHSGQVPGKQILRAEMRLWQFYAGTCEGRPLQIHPVTQAWAGGMTWSPQPAVTGVGSLTVTENHGAAGCGDNWTRADVTGMVQGWSDGSIPNEGVRLTVPIANAATAAYGRRFCSIDVQGGSVCGSAEKTPKLSVTYNTRPDAPQTLNATVTDASPTLSATVSDPDGDSVRARFKVKKADVVVFDTVTAPVASGSRASVTLDPLTLGTYTFEVWTNDALLTSYSPAPSSSFTISTVVGGAFQSTEPVLLTDTSAPGGTPFAAGETRQFTPGQLGLPAANVSAVMLTMTAKSATEASSVKAWSSTDPTPTTALLQFDSSTTPTTNSAIVKIGSDGKIKVQNVAGTTNLSMSVVGYFTIESTSTTTGGYVPVSPVKVADTQTGTGVPAQRISGLSQTDIQVPTSTVPLGAKAVFANVAVTDGLGSGAIKFAAGGADTSDVPTSLQYTSDRPVTLGLIIPLDSQGRIRIVLPEGAAGVHVRIDVTGYFAANVADETGLLHPLPQSKLVDTHDTVPLAGGETRTFTLAGVGGVPATGAGTVPATLIVSDWQESGSVEVFSAGLEPASVPTSRFVSSSAPIPTTVTTFIEPSTDGKVSIRNDSAGTVHVRLTAQGWFTAYDQESYLSDVDEDEWKEEYAPPAGPGIARIVFSNGLPGTDGQPMEWVPQDIAPSDVQSAGAPVGSAQNWPSCAGRPQKKYLRTYKRRAVSSGMKGESAWLQCGVQTANGRKSWGQRHIAARHATGWKSVAVKSGYAEAAWESAADAFVSYALAVPSRTKTGNDPGESWCYSVRMDVYRNNEVVATYYPEVWIGKTGRKVITAIMTRRGCK